MPVDRRTPQPIHQQTHRRRQKLSRLRPMPQSLSGRLFGLLQEGANPPIFDIVAARGDDSYHKMIVVSSKTNLLILDDWGLEELSREQSLDMLEVLEDRYGRGSTILTTQVPVDQ
ncbi:hypothetical protein DFAR_1540002 [Desulfarculales bacterium]